MATLKEILAAKKAASAAAQNNVVPVITVNAAIIVENDPSPTEKIVESKTPMSVLAAMEFNSEINDVSAELEKKASIPPKPMTFAEKMAAKKLLLEGKKDEPQAQTLEQPNKAEETIKEKKEVTLTDDQKEVISEIADPEMAQAYSDIALKINTLLVTDTGDSLENAMTNLKKALHKNPAASMMLLDTDIGQMTIALRRMVAMDLEEKESGKSKKDSKPPKKTGNVVLTAEQLAVEFSDM